MKLTRWKLPEYDAEYDVKLVCGEKIFSTHRLLLAASSCFLMDIIQDACENSSEELLTILLPDFDHEEVGNLVSMLYNAKHVNAGHDIHSYAKTTVPTNLSPIISQLRVGETPMKAPSVLLQQKKKELQENVEDSLSQSVEDTDEVYQQILDMTAERLVNGSWVKLDLSLKKDGVETKNACSEFNCENCCKDLVRCSHQSIPHCKECNPCTGCYVEEFPMDDLTTTPVDLVDNGELESGSIFTTSEMEIGSDLPFECSEETPNTCGELYGQSSASANLYSSQRQAKLLNDRRPHKCDQCEQKYADKRDLKRHVLRKHSDTEANEKSASHVCDVCQQVFLTKWALTKHSKVEHFKVFPFICQFCEKGFNTKQILLEHENKHKGQKLHKCDLCGEAFYTRRCLILHIGKVHPGEVLIKCYYCSETFDSAEGRTIHMEANHPGTDRYPKKILDLYDGSIIGVNKSFVCDVCSQAFEFEHQLTNHLRVHTGERPFKCSQCCKSFTLHGSLTKHMRKHTGKWPFPCDLCPKGYDTISKLNEHKLRHLGKKTVECGLCDKVYYTVKNLKYHMKNCHDTEKPFSCDLCSEKFSKNRHLVGHMRKIHNSDKQIMCTVCNKVFSVKHSLIRHMRKVHQRVNNVKPLKQ